MQHFVDRSTERVALMMMMMMMMMVSTSSYPYETLRGMELHS
jgi:hypothetical protein